MSTPPPLNLLKAEAMELPDSFGHAACVACQIARITEMLCQGRLAHPLGLVFQSVLTWRSHCLPQEADLGYTIEWPII